MKYVVVNCIDREILNVGVSDNPKEATEIMKNDFINELINNGYDAENFVEECDDWSFSGTEAWMNGRYSSHYDWRILTV